MQEIETARAILRDSEPLKFLKETSIERYLKLENLLSQVVLNGEFPSHLSEAKRAKREQLFSGTRILFQQRFLSSFVVILDQVPEVPQNRLLALIQSALRWEEQKGNIPENAVFDLFHGVLPAEIASESIERLPKSCFNTVELPTGSQVECAGFSPNGAYFIVGTADGFLEVWDPIRGSLRNDLPYQTGEHDVMKVASAITCLAFSADSELLVCGCISGEVAVWRLSSGKLVKAFPKIHEKGVTNVSFSPDLQSVLSCGFDNQIRVLGMKSGRVLKEFRGHESYVNCALWLEDGKMVLSGGHDGSVKLWDAQCVDCIGSFVPTEGNVLSPPPIRSIFPFKNTENDTLFLVVTQSQTLHLFSLAQRAFVKQIICKGVKFLTAQVRKDFVFALTEDGSVFAYRPEENSSAVASNKVADVEPINFCSHPSLSLLISFDISGKVKFWK